MEKEEEERRRDYSNGEDTAADSELLEISEETHKFFTTSCTRSVLNKARKHARSRYPLPKEVATKTPSLDLFMRLEISTGAKALDKDLAKIQTFVLDSMAPLTALLE